MSSSARSRAEGPATNSRELQPSARGAKLRPADVCDVEPCDAVQPCFGTKPAERTQVWTNCGPPLREASARRRLRRRALRRGATLLRSEACGALACLLKLRASAGGGCGPPTSTTSSLQRNTPHAEAAARRAFSAIHVQTTAERTGLRPSGAALRQGAAAGCRATARIVVRGAACEAHATSCTRAAGLRRGEAAARRTACESARTKRFGLPIPHGIETRNAPPPSTEIARTAAIRSGDLRVQMRSDRYR